MTLTLAPDVKEVPGPTSWLPGGNFLAFRRNPLTFFTKTARTYGDVARFSFGSQPVYLVSHPHFIEDVLVTSAKKFMKGMALQRAKKLLGEGLLTSEAQMHLRQRRTIQPMFHRQQVQRFGESMVKHALRWRETITDGATIDITAEMGNLTLAIVGETLFSTNVQRDADDVREALSDAVQSSAYAMLPGIELFERLPIGPFVKVRKARARLDKIIHRVIAERRANPDAKHDLIAMLLAARDPENPSEPGMSDQQIRDEAMTIFLAGYETTANAMSWTWHLLGSAPHVEEKLYSEIRSVLGDRPPTVEDVSKLEFTRSVIAESMRVYPPAWTMGRRALEPHQVGGYEVEKDALVLMSQWVVHHDPRWWPDPLAFRPERWLPEARRPKFAYFPFGGGGRLCIGEPFAWTEAILLLATIAQRWSFNPVTPPTPEARITLRPRGLAMRAIAR
jgi:cytochrome P450